MRTSNGDLLRSRFWAKVEIGDGCWEWQGARGVNGYGHIKVARHQRLAHRVGWELEYGPIPIRAQVLHRCDNPPCVRPDHLFLGTQSDNIRDMDKKRRRVQPDPSARPRGDDHWSHRRPELVRRGEHHHKAKMTAEQVSELRTLSASGWTLGRLAERYGIRISTASYIVRRETWRDVP